VNDEADTHAEEESTAAEVANGTGRQNIRSTIAFPYTSLSDAEDVARALRRRGDTATMDAVAAELGQTVSGAFRTKIATARTFGVIDVRRGQVQLTQLGHRITDPDQAEQARVEAFLHVPLFLRVFEEYRGRNLPPAKGLEAAIERFGVSPKQSDRARQTLQRSAEQAGFFRHGTDRLVAPALSGSGGQNANVQTPQTPSSAVEGLPAWAVQMWLTLLNDGGDWSPEQVKAYVDGARTAYKAAPQ
jgi:hypothetical protein